ncbi:hypothetical protein GGP41_004948 [Bipolaris sorokiniana]|uniref:Uncharacterized protein n=1 Tax=Cochliobolus sativus TaxID=45130 RepID=A0A8H5Z667_COCSA|nr:hypothetical protein GGP41_004948 [Bipolaris sorokiniana]
MTTALLFLWHKKTLSQRTKHVIAFGSKDPFVRIPYQLAFVEPSVPPRFEPMHWLYGLISHVPQSCRFLDDDVRMAPPV